MQIIFGVDMLYSMLISVHISGSLMKL